ncbi:MAG: GspE/PulE family protein [Planctomycetota bacterium]|jgi:type II secretory ATPase GspE/PulE/Tfp pilus assembly ATPase PilB-like protein
MVPDALSDEVIRTRESGVKWRVAAPDEEESLDVLESASAPAIRLANSIIAEAVRAKASDIHLEPMEKELALRLRVDGMLMLQNPVPKAVQGPLLSRIKIMARLDIAERRVPQDGRIRVLCDQRPVDLRVSTLPTRHGEKIVIRILDKSAISLDLDALGLEEQPMAALRESIAKRHGILLVTGPTGSGKTTTLYSALTALNRPQSNIVTVEDPIEYDLARVNQVQVHPVAGLTFPAALRAILRQDPDIIMVGEIRDGETLDIAMKAALTGHLVLSTLHTNDAVSTICRLLDMGSEPFLAASTVEMISAQRLLRRLCPQCREPAKVPDEVLEGFGVPLHDQMEFFRAKGCPECSKVGYRGRLAVSEVLVMDEGLRQLVSRAADRGALRRHVSDMGQMRTLRQNAFLRAARGLTSLEEVLRVTG